MERLVSSFALRGKKVTVIGLGRFGGGVGVTRWLCGQGARVTVSDKAAADSLPDSIAALKGLDVQLHLGGHVEADFLQADLLIVNPAIPKEMPLLRSALSAGVPYTTEINLFLERCAAPVIGITGSVGKSTTTAMIGAILAKSLTAHVGGNIGKSLLEELPAITPDHVVVLELSSFQLEDLPIIGISPHVAVVTNLARNHLDRHGTMEAYAAAKKNIFRFQKPADVLILNADDPIVSQWAGEAPGRVAFFRRVAGVPVRGPKGLPAVTSSVSSSSSSSSLPFSLSVPGAHNQANAQAAWAAAKEMGVSRAQAEEALREFAGLPHRLQFVAELDGVRYFNDSKCTTPGGAIVALESFDPRRVVIIVGGYDKGADFDKLGTALAQRAKAVVGIGKTRDKIVAAAKAHHQGDVPTIELAENLDSAVRAARRLASRGDVVLLSPACASYDMFTNYEDRGNQFVELVKNDTRRG
jgi:UDP-N-acetylmuramoylalanine--D-glutamate ligase